MKGFNPVLAVGIALPALLIIILFVVIFLPASLLKPEYDFVYSNEYENYYTPQYLHTYRVTDGHITKIENTLREKQIPEGDAPNLYVYNVAQNTSKHIEFEEAQKLTVDPGPSSPDGFTIGFNYSNSGGFFFFGSSGSESGYFIKKGNSGKRLTGLTNGDRYSQNVRFIGWVLKK